MVMKRRDTDRFSTFSDQCHYSQKVLLDHNGQAILSSIVLYFFGLERHNFTKKNPPGVFFSAVFSNSLNMKRHWVLPLSDSLNSDDIGFCRNDTPQAYVIPVKLVKNNRGTRQKWRGKNRAIIIVMSAVCRSWTWHLSAFVSRWGHLISFFHLPPWIWVILFDLSSAHWLVTMTFDPLTSNTAKSTVVPSICSREVDLCNENNLPLIARISWFTTLSLRLVSMMWEKLWPTFDQGRLLSTSAHYPRSWSRDSLPVPWSLHASMAGSSCSTWGFHHWLPTEWFYGCSTSDH